MLSRLTFALGVSLCAALAVQLSFGAAFVENGVGYATTVYVAALVAVLLRFPNNSGAASRWPVRVLVGLALGSLGLWVLRGPALWTLPVGSFVTTGHSPFVAFPLTTLLAAIILEGLHRWSLRATSNDASPAAQALKG